MTCHLQILSRENFKRCVDGRFAFRKKKCTQSVKYLDNQIDHLQKIIDCGV